MGEIYCTVVYSIRAGAEFRRLCLNTQLLKFSEKIRKSKSPVSHVEVDVLAIVERTLGSESHLGFLLLLRSVILGKATSLDLNCVL